MTLFSTVPKAAFTVPLTVVVVGAVAIVKDTEDVPAAIVTGDAGSVAFTLVFVSVTVVSTAAFPVRVTVPVTFAPPVTLAGERVRVERIGAFTVRFLDDVTLPSVAEIARVVFAATGKVAMVNVALDAPAGTVTDTGTEAALSVL